MSEKKVGDGVAFPATLIEVRQGWAKLAVRWIAKTGRAQQSTINVPSDLLRPLTASVPTEFEGALYSHAQNLELAAQSLRDAASLLRLAAARLAQYRLRDATTVSESDTLGERW